MILCASTPDLTPSQAVVRLNWGRTDCGLSLSSATSQQSHGGNLVLNLSVPPFPFCEVGVKGSPGSQVTGGDEKGLGAHIEPQN